MRFLTPPSASSAQPKSKAAEPKLRPIVPWTRYLLFISLAVGGCAVDLLSKHWVFEWLGLPPMRGQMHGAENTWWLSEGYVGIQTALNFGALFGMGQGQVMLFSCLSVVAALGILYWLFVARAASDRLLTFALGCVMGGILGNLYDRLGLWSHPDLNGQRLCGVRDWILLRYGEYTWPNFNIADCLLVCGAGLLMWHALFSPQPKTQPQPADEPEKS
jgi:signal peptidase II